MFNDISIGCDIESIERFKNKTRENDMPFLERIYTPKELEYCFSKGTPQQHLCARFCAKEAIVKALSDFNISNVYYNDIEIINRENGAPTAAIAKYPQIKIKVSLSHCKEYAIANVLLHKI